MTSVSRFALGASLALGASALVSTSVQAQRAPRGNQQRPQPAQVQAQGRTLALSPQERAVLVPLDAAARGTDRAAQDAALAAARPVLRSADARYAFARYQMRIAIQRNDNAMLSQSVDMAIDSGVAPPEELPTYLNSQAEIALAARDNAKAERALTRLGQLRPGDVDLQARLAQLRVNQGRVGEGLRALQAAIAARTATGQPAPESWYRFGLARSYESRDAAVRGQALGFARSLVTAYPTPVNWRDALLIYRETANLDAQANLDLSRLMLAAGALAGERDFYDFANTLNQAGFPGEAKAVLDAGISRRMVDASRSPFRELLSTTNARMSSDRASLPREESNAMAAATGVSALKIGDAFYGYGEHSKAISLYRVALTKGGVDPNVVNTRLAMALFASGDRAGAETAFRAVTGPRAELAAFWLLWLQQRGG